MLHKCTWCRCRPLKDRRSFCFILQNICATKGKFQSSSVLTPFRVTEEVTAKLMESAYHRIERDGILATRLCTHKDDVELTNENKLQQLPGLNSSFWFIFLVWNRCYFVWFQSRWNLAKLLSMALSHVWQPCWNPFPLEIFLVSARCHLFSDQFSFLFWYTFILSAPASGNWWGATPPVIFWGRGGFVYNLNSTEVGTLCKT